MYNKKRRVKYSPYFCYIGLFRITLFVKGLRCGLEEAITVLLGVFLVTCFTAVTCLLEAPPLQEHAIVLMFVYHI